MKHKQSTEELYHFRCGKCKKWWTIGDAPKEKKKWFCPWCGTEEGIRAEGSRKEGKRK